MNFFMLRPEYINFSLGISSSRQFILWVLLSISFWCHFIGGIVISLIFRIEAAWGIDLSIMYQKPDVELKGWELLLIPPIVETIFFNLILQNTARFFINNKCLEILLMSVIFSSFHFFNSFLNGIFTLFIGVAFFTIYEYFRVKNSMFTAFIVVTVVHFLWNFGIFYDIS